MARLSFRCDDELLAAVDRARGDVPRELWLRKTVQREVDRAGSNSRAVEQALGDRMTPVQAEAPPAPAEQPTEGLARVDSILSGLDPSPFARRPLSSSQSKRDVRPIPKKGER